MCDFIAEFLRQNFTKLARVMAQHILRSLYFFVGLVLYFGFGFDVMMEWILASWRQLDKSSNSASC